RLAAEKAEADRIAQEKAEAERLAFEKAETERIAQEKAEAERIAQEKAEAERLTKEAEAKAKSAPQPVAEAKKLEEKVPQPETEAHNLNINVAAEPSAGKSSVTDEARPLSEAQKSLANSLPKINHVADPSSAEQQVEQLVHLAAERVSMTKNREEARPDSAAPEVPPHDTNKQVVPEGNRSAPPLPHKDGEAFCKCVIL
ncbi:hypothetical protein HDU91_005233, partial [Kappamyces sp. JEL0680]